MPADTSIIKWWQSGSSVALRKKSRTLLTNTSCCRLQYQTVGSILEKYQKVAEVQCLQHKNKPIMAPTSSRLIYAVVSSLSLHQLYHTTARPTSVRRKLEVLVQITPSSLDLRSSFDLYSSSTSLHCEACACLTVQQLDRRSQVRISKCRRRGTTCPALLDTFIYCDILSMISLCPKSSLFYCRSFRSAVRKKRALSVLFVSPFCSHQSLVPAESQFRCRSAAACHASVF